MNIEKGIPNDKVDLLLALPSKLIILCSLFEIQLSLTS